MSIEIPGIGSSAYYTTRTAAESSTLTGDQRQLIEQTLSSYDPENLTQADAAAIVGLFSDAGIGQGAALTQALADFGFDARTIGEMAGAGVAPGGSMPPPPNGGGVLTLNIDDEMLQQLNQLLTDYYDSDLTDAEKSSTLDAIKNIFQQTLPEGGLVDIRA